MSEPILSIRLLGEFEVRQGDRAAPLESARAESLLAYLLLHRAAAQSRERVAFLLWPDSDEAQARTNLRHVLHNLRRALPEPDRYLDVTAQTLRWRQDAPCRLDVAAFEEAFAKGDLQRAVDAYTGDLLAGRTQDEWVQEDRDRLRGHYLDALNQLVTGLEGGGDLPGAVRYAERLLRADRLREESYQVLIRLHDAHGDRARALRVYYECVATLEHELGVEPAAATRAAYDALLPHDKPPAVQFGGAPLVGRAAERSVLAGLWRDLRQNSARAVLLTGEPGVGKTRLAEEFRAWCAHRGAITAFAQCYPSEGALAYGPVISWLRSAELAPRLRGLDKPHRVELARLLPEVTAEVPPLLPESEQRARLYDAVARLLLRPRTPLVLLADDVQWWDQESLRLVHYLVRARPGGPLLVVATARREDIERTGPLNDLLLALRAAERLTEVELDRLAATETATLAERLRRSPLSTADAEVLYAQTDGNPLFVVEAMRAGWRAGDTLLTPKVQATIESGFAQLSPGARDLVDLAATIGRQFTAELLSMAGPADEDTVVRGLDELWRRRVVRERDATAYDFSHDKIREVAYLTLSPVRRRHLHRQVARALERVHEGGLAAVGGELARHYDAAGLIDQAVDWYARAADVAQQVYAHAESARLLTRAIELVRTLPPTASHRRRELELLTVLPAPLIAGEGYVSARVVDMHRRALELARSLGTGLAPPMLRSLALGALTRGDFAGAREFGLQLRDRARRTGEDLLLVESEYVLGITAFWAAELEQARTHFENVVEHYRDEHRAEHLLRYGQDPKTVCLTRLALTWWFLGEPEAAVRARDAGLAHAERIGHPYTRTVSLIFAALLALDMDDVAALREFIVAVETGRPPDPGSQMWAIPEALRSYLDVVDGRPGHGIAALRRLLADPRLDESTAPGQRSCLVRILLAACDVAGDAPTGLTAAGELLAIADSRVWDREAARLRERFRAANA